jgi:ATP-dependent DNA helicase PIF1
MGFGCASGFSPEQRVAFDLGVAGKNVFVTGPGGTGKTFWIQSFVKEMQARGKSVTVCAMTGCAAVLLGTKARTLHSWSGVRLARGSRESIIDSVLRNRAAIKNWRGCDVLVVDEVSMMSLKMFEVLDDIGRRLRRLRSGGGRNVAFGGLPIGGSPFGGLHVVFVGDFFQLPPVGESGDADSAKFCFQSERWFATFARENCVVFTTVFRQRDEAYARLLGEVRVGALSAEGRALLEGRVKQSEDDCGVGVGDDVGNGVENDCDKGETKVTTTRIFPVKYKVDAVNRFHFDKLGVSEMAFSFVEKRNCRTYLESGLPIPSELLLRGHPPTGSREYEAELGRLMANVEERVVLKVGAVVMLTYNLSVEEGLCNGSQGVVVGLEVTGDVIAPVVQFRNGVKRRIGPHFWQSDEWPVLAVGQVPLILAWALTIHKIQGATLDCAEMDLGESVFEYGQTYVALSRVRTLEGITLKKFSVGKIRAHPLVQAFYEGIADNK